MHVMYIYIYILIFSHKTNECIHILFELTIVFAWKYYSVFPIHIYIFRQACLPNLHLLANIVGRSVNQKSVSRNLLKLSHRIPILESQYWLSAFRVLKSVLKYFCSQVRFGKISVLLQVSYEFDFVRSTVNIWIRYKASEHLCKHNVF